jgi:hypothetical protein
LETSGLKPTPHARFQKKHTRDFTLLPGTYKKENFYITGVYRLYIYAFEGDFGSEKPNQIPPQKLHVTASIKQDPVNGDTIGDLDSQSGTWYQIDTKNGKRWIHNPDYLEQVVETPVSYTVTLMGNETFYPHPFLTEPASVTLEEKEVEVVAEWTTGHEPFIQTWLKVRLPQADFWKSHGQ